MSRPRTFTEHGDEYEIADPAEFPDGDNLDSVEEQAAQDAAEGRTS